MTDYRNEDINPEDFWPEAEQILDRHFQQKKKRRALYLLLLLLLFTAGGILVWYASENKNSTVVTSNTNSSTGTPVNAENKNLTSTKNDNVPVLESTTEKNTTTNSEQDQQTQRTTSQKIVAAESQINKSKQTKEVVAGIAISSTPNIQEEKSTSLTESVITTDQISGTPITATTLPVDQSTLAETIFPAPLLSTSLIIIDTSTYYGIREIPTLHTSKKSSLGLLLYGGAQSISKEITAPPSRIDLTRRSAEESAAILPYTGIQLMYGKGKWDFRAGLELNVQGEKVNYTPYTTGEYYHNYNKWEQFQTTVTDTDSTYIMGILFLNSHVVMVNDSNYVSVTDTLNGNHYDASVLQANGTNRYYFIEMPLEVAYTRVINRWGVGVSAGVSPAYLVATDGYQLKQDQSGYEKIKADSYNRILLNARAGLEFSYMISPKMKILLRPSGRINLTPLKDETGTKYRYKSAGVNAGILYQFR